MQQQLPTVSFCFFVAQQAHKGPGTDLLPLSCLPCNLKSAAAQRAPQLPAWRPVGGRALGGLGGMPRLPAETPGGIPRELRDLGRPWPGAEQAAGCRALHCTTTSISWPVQLATDGQGGPVLPHRHDAGLHLAPEKLGAVQPHIPLRRAHHLRNICQLHVSDGEDTEQGFCSS